MHQGRAPAPCRKSALIRGGYISEQEVARIYGEDLFLPVISSNVEAGAVDKEVGALLPEKLCLDRLFCPLACGTTSSTSSSSRPRRWASSTSSTS